MINMLHTDSNYNESHAKMIVMKTGTTRKDQFSVRIKIRWQHIFTDLLYP